MVEFDTNRDTICSYMYSVHIHIPQQSNYIIKFARPFDLINPIRLLINMNGYQYKIEFSPQSVKNHKPMTHGIEIPGRMRTESI